MTTISLDFTDDELNAIKVLAKVNHTSPEAVITDMCRDAFKELFEHPLEYILSHIDNSPVTMPVQNEDEPPLEIPIAKPYSERKPKTNADTKKHGVDTFTGRYFEKNEGKVKLMFAGNGATLDSVVNKLIVEEGKTQDKNQYRASKANLKYWLEKKQKAGSPITHSEGSQTWVWANATQPRITQVPSVTAGHYVKVTSPVRKPEKREPALPKMGQNIFVDDMDKRQIFMDILVSGANADPIKVHAIVDRFSKQFQKESVEKATEIALFRLKTSGILKYNASKQEWKFTSHGMTWADMRRKSNDSEA